MEFTLILKDRQMKFYVLAVAELYQQIHGGVLLKNNKPYLRLVDKLAA